MWITGSRERRDIDYQTGLLLPLKSIRNQLTGEKIRPGQIHFQHLLPDSRRQLPGPAAFFLCQRTVTKNSGVVYEDIHTPKLLRGLVHEQHNRAFVGDVELSCDHLTFE